MAKREGDDLGCMGIWSNLRKGRNYLANCAREDVLERVPGESVMADGNHKYWDQYLGGFW
jgi:hypothetical protein